MKILFFLSDNSVSGGSLARPRLTERKYNARESDEGGQYKVPRESTRGHPSVSAPILYTLEQGGLQVVSDHLSAALSSLCFQRFSRLRQDYVKRKQKEARF